MESILSLLPVRLKSHIRNPIYYTEFTQQLTQYSQKEEQCQFTPILTL